MNNKLRAWDHFNEIMVYSNEDDAVFILHENKWKIKYTREKTLQNGDVEIDAPVWEESDDVEVMLGLGKLDKNKVPIYEGDIVTWHGGGAGGANKKGDVYYEDGRFLVRHYGLGFMDDPNDAFGEGLHTIHVIGNIYQHPNLLK